LFRGLEDPAHRREHRNSHWIDYQPIVAFKSNWYICSVTGTFVLMPTQAPPRTSPKSPPRGEARRGHIVEAALAVIADRGPDGLTHRRVAAEAGLPLAATTYWFASKEELVLAAFEFAADRDLARLAERRAAAGSWTRETIAGELARTIHEHLVENRSLVVLDCCLWVEALRRPELRAVEERWAAGYLEFYVELLRQIDPATTLDEARIVSAAVDGLFTRELTCEPPQSPRRIAALLERLFRAIFDRA
jgi:TetR/AcrR family transcriptional regulator, regulator of biofilm formation and stress response